MSLLRTGSSIPELAGDLLKGNNQMSHTGRSADENQRRAPRGLSHARAAGKESFEGCACSASMPWFSPLMAFLRRRTCCNNCSILILMLLVALSAGNPLLHRAYWLVLRSLIRLLAMIAFGRRIRCHDELRSESGGRGTCRAAVRFGAERGGSRGASPSRGSAPSRRKCASGAAASGPQAIEYVDGQPTIVFDTLCTKLRERVLACDEFHDVFRSVAAEANAWALGRYVIMPDHVHFFAADVGSDVPYERWVTYLKSRITKELGARRGGGGGAIDGESAARREPRPPGKPPAFRWLTDHWDTRVRNCAAYETQWQYVLITLCEVGWFRGRTSRGVRARCLSCGGINGGRRRGKIGAARRAAGLPVPILAARREPRPPDGLALRLPTRRPRGMPIAWRTPAE